MTSLLCVVLETKFHFVTLASLELAVFLSWNSEIPLTHRLGLKVCSAVSGPQKLLKCFKIACALSTRSVSVLSLEPCSGTWILITVGWGHCLPEDSYVRYVSRWLSVCFLWGPRLHLYQGDYQVGVPRSGGGFAPHPTGLFVTLWNRLIFLGREATKRPTQGSPQLSAPVRHHAPRLFLCTG